MDNAIAKAIQRDAADALLDIGISIALKEFRLPLRKRPVKLRVTLKRPYMSGQIRFARTYLSMGVTYEEMDKFTKEQQMQFVATHGHKIALMLADAICVGPVKRLFVRPVAWFIRNCVEQRFLLGGMRKFVSLMGTDPFLPIIRSVERTNPMKPRLSREANGS
nr:MAG TPA: hypothetical protein [Caudoviricetes sp.]